MARKLAGHDSPTKAAKHYGFRPDGSSFSADAPVDNLATRCLWELARKVRDGLLRPDETVYELSRLPEAVHRLIPTEAASQWSTLDRYWQWSVAWIGSPAASTLKYRVALVPMDSDNDAAWLARVRAAELRHGEPAYGTYFRVNGKDYPVHSGPSPATALAELLSPKPIPRTDEEAMAERDRQLAAFRARNPVQEAEVEALTDFLSAP